MSNDDLRAPRPAVRSLPARATSWLLSNGHVAPSTVHRHGLVARDVSQSNGVAVVELGDGTGFAVKDMGAHVDLAQGSPAQEIRFYEVVQHAHELPVISPRLIDSDASEQFLVLEALVRHRRMDQVLAHRDLLGIDLSSAIGTALGTWHRHARDASYRVAEVTPWVSRIDTNDRLAVLDQPPFADVLARILDDSTLAEVPALSRRVWCADTLMHGDVRFANLLVATSPLDIRLVDWETSGRGDHRWDLAGVLQEYVVREVDAALDSGRIGMYRAGQAAESCRVAYGDAWGADDSWRELAPFVALRLIMRAMQLASWQATNNDEIDHHLEVARRLLHSARVD